MRKTCPFRASALWPETISDYGASTGGVANFSHRPGCLTDTPAAAATHGLPYVFPSQPQTGAKIFVQTSGFVSQTPVWSANPH
jgi:hypothetical protein